MPRKPPPIPQPHVGAFAPPRRRILVLGSVRDTPEILGETQGASAVLAPFSALDAGLLVRVRPEVIVAQVIGTDHDVADLAERLADMGFVGVLRSYSRPIPRRDEVAQALAEAFPDIRFEFVELPR